MRATDDQAHISKAMITAFRTILSSYGQDIRDLWSLKLWCVD